MNHTENLPAQEVVGATPPDFDAIRHFDENGVEYWLARELYPILEYATWQRFVGVIERAKQACFSLNINVDDHFNNTVKMIELGKGGQRQVEDIALSRYACYLIVQNGDPAKPVIAAGQTYFAIQTRRQELEDQESFAELNDDQKRLLLRREVAEHNKRLVDAAHDAGVIDAMDYAIFQNYGNKGLYGGLGQREIHAKKGLKKSQKILDYMGHEELAANLFRATQTESKLRREGVMVRIKQTARTSPSGGRFARQSSDSAGPCRKTCQPPRKASSSLNAKNGSGLRRKTVARKSGNAISPSPALGYAKRALVQRPAHIAI